MKTADVEDDVKPGANVTENAELRERRHCNRLLEQENEVLSRAAPYLSHANLPENDVPARPQAGRRRDPRHDDVPGPQAMEADQDMPDHRQAPRGHTATGPGAEAGDGSGRFRLAR
ncbi:hypothetical protein GCM10028772_22720 [Nocardioides ultimimeridianus]